MRALIQRVREAKVTVGEETTGQIGPGILIFLGVHASDTPEVSAWMAKKCAQLRIFADEDGKMNRSVKDIFGRALVVSQFTLYGDASRGRRPSFTGALAPAQAEPLYEYFVDKLRSLGPRVATGRFGAMMAVSLVNDGPVTLWLDTATLRERSDGAKGAS